MHHRDRPADGERGGREDPRRGRVRRAPVVHRKQSAPDPAGPLPRDDRGLVLRRDVDDDVTRLVQPAGVVLVEIAFGPAGAGPGLPDQRRVARIDADAGDAAVQPDVHGAGRDRFAETDQQRVARAWYIRKTRESVLAGQRGGEIGRRTVGRRRAGSRERTRNDFQVLRRGEDDRLVDVRPRRRDLGPGADQHGLRLRRGQPERHSAAGRRRWPELDADQLEEFHIVQVGNPVHPVDQLVDHLRERLDQRHAGIGDVVIAPVRAAPLDQPLRLVHQPLEGPVVQVRRGQHVRPPTRAAA